VRHTEGLMFSPLNSVEARGASGTLPFRSASLSDTNYCFVR
jgi:hypothetical protein